MRRAFGVVLLLPAAAFIGWLVFLFALACLACLAGDTGALVVGAGAMVVGCTVAGIVLLDPTHRAECPARPADPPPMKLQMPGPSGAVRPKP